MCEWDIKTIPRPQEFYRASEPRPVLKFLDPPLLDFKRLDFTKLIIEAYRKWIFMALYLY